MLHKFYNYKNSKRALTTTVVLTVGKRALLIYSNHLVVDYISPSIACIPDTIKQSVFSWLFIIIYKISPKPNLQEILHPVIASHGIVYSLNLQNTIQLCQHPSSSNIDHSMTKSEISSEILAASPFPIRIYSFTKKNKIMWNANKHITTFYFSFRRGKPTAAARLVNPRTSKRQRYDLFTRSNRNRSNLYRYIFATRGYLPPHLSLHQNNLRF